MIRVSITLLLLITTTCGGPEEGLSRNPPNIILILADDMGYGDPGCYNPLSKTPTPNLDRLAAEGIRFTDAHAPASWCVPSRYGLLTGRYPCRATLDWRSRAVIESGRLTIATLLKQSGYITAMVGKWHLGFDGGPDYDFTRPLRGGPLDQGFDSYFGIPHSLDITPYYYIRNRLAVQAPSGLIEANASGGWSPIQGAFWRAGQIAPDFRHIDVLPRFVEKAIDIIEGHARTESGPPLFLYLALPAPHTPWLPTAAFKGQGAAGMYGEFVAQVDDVVGQVLKALDEAGMSENTLLIFSSDNGPVWYEVDVERYGHDSAGPFRGMKGDAWEAGHRVPFIVRWPGRVEPGQVSSYLVTFTDLLATFASLVGYTLPSDAGEDSFDVLPAVLGESKERPVEQAIVFKADATVVRKGPWKLITHLGSGGLSKPKRVQPFKDSPEGQLYNLQDDSGETENLWSDRPDLVRELTSLLDGYRRRGRSRP